MTVLGCSVSDTLNLAKAVSKVEFKLLETPTGGANAFAESRSPSASAGLLAFLGAIAGSPSPSAAGKQHASPERVPKVRPPGVQLEKPPMEENLHFHLARSQALALALPAE